MTRLWGRIGCHVKVKGKVTVKVMGKGTGKVTVKVKVKVKGKVTVKVMGKVKFTLEQAMKAQRGSRCIALIFLQPRR